MGSVPLPIQPVNDDWRQYERQPKQNDWLQKGHAMAAVVLLTSFLLCSQTNRLP
jgi:hypothetical protein